MAMRITMDRVTDLIDFGTDPYDSIDAPDFDDYSDSTVATVVSFHAPRDEPTRTFDRWYTTPEVWER